MRQSNVINPASMRTGDTALFSWLSERDPDPVEIVNAGATSPIMLLCEHAGQAVPQILGDLGLKRGVIDQHIGWDIGAEKLARVMAQHLGCTLIIQRYSRLVIDCNRPPHATGSIPAVSDNVVIPLNKGVTSAEAKHRRQAIFDPLDQAIAAQLDRYEHRAVFSIHSYTRVFNGRYRPWDAGFLSRRDLRTAGALLERIGAADPRVTLALNQPYQIDDDSDWFIPHHAEPRGLAHTLIEICNDQLLSEAGLHRWASLLSDAINSTIEQNP